MVAAWLYRVASAARYAMASVRALASRKVMLSGVSLNGVRDAFYAGLAAGYLFVLEIYSARFS